MRLAHQLAIESDLVTADMVESSEFPHLANKYSVMAVPKTVVNTLVDVVHDNIEQIQGYATLRKELLGLDDGFLA